MNYSEDILIFKKYLIYNIVFSLNRIIKLFEINSVPLPYSPLLLTSRILRFDFLNLVLQLFQFLLSKLMIKYKLIRILLKYLIIVISSLILIEQLIIISYSQSQLSYIVLTFILIL